MKDVSTFSYLVNRDTHQYAEASRELAIFPHSETVIRQEVLYRNRVMASIETALCFQSPTYVANAIFEYAPEVYLNDLGRLVDKFDIYLHGGVSMETRKAFVEAYRKRYKQFREQVESRVTA